MSRIYTQTGRAFLVGVTGAPGTGKSTLVDRLIAEVRRAGLKVGVIAVDPTSPFSGGAVLGDRVRMNAHAADSGVFIRSMATRGHLGGLARATSDAALVLDAAGSDVVIIETVGVGQDEVDIVSAADISIVLLVPGAGDDLQAIKAGVMEIARHLRREQSRPRRCRSCGAGRRVEPVAQDVRRLRMETADSQDRSHDWCRCRCPVEGESAGSENGRASIGSRAGGNGTCRGLRDLLALSFLRHVDGTLPPEEFDRYIEAVASRARDPYSVVEEIMNRIPSPGSRIPG